MATPLRAQAPEPSLYGLVNPKTVVNESDRWISGFEQESISCMADVRLLDTCETGVDVDVIQKTGSGSLGEYIPFTVQAEVACSTMGKQEDWVAYGTEALELCQNKAIELEFWEGRLARAAGEGG